MDYYFIGHLDFTANQNYILYTFLEALATSAVTGNWKRITDQQYDKSIDKPGLTVTLNAFN